MQYDNIITYDLLQDLYVNKKYTLEKMVEAVGCKSTRTISVYLEKFGIQSRGLDKYKIEKADLIEMLIQKQMNISEIARHYGCTDTRVQQKMKEFNINYQSIIKNWNGYIHKEDLENYIFIDKKAIGEIADIYNCCPTTVKDKLIKFDLWDKYKQMKEDEKDAQENKEKEQIINLYIEKRMPASEVCKALGFTEGQLSGKLVKYKIKLKEYNIVHFSLPREVLHQLYVVEEMDVKEIANKYNVGYNTISNLIKKYKIRKIERTEGIVISDIQHDLIIGSILGDGHIRKMRKSGNDNATLSVQHNISQIDYLREKYTILKNLCTGEVKISKKNEGTNKNPTYYFSTKCLPQLNKYYDMSNFELIDNINPNVLCIWYFDDGTMDKRSLNGNTNISISMKWLGEDGVGYLVEKLKRDYDLDCRINRVNEIVHGINFRVEETKKFFGLIKTSYFHSLFSQSMAYKL